MAISISCPPFRIMFGGTLSASLRAIAALLFATVLQFGVVPAVGAGTLTFFFSDDGRTTTITPYGSLDVTGLKRLQEKGVRRSSLVLLGWYSALPQIDTKVWSFPASPSSPTVTFYDSQAESTASTLSFFGDPDLEPEELQKLRLRELGAFSYRSNFHFLITESKKQIEIDSSFLSGTTVDYSGAKATFDGTLLERLEDDDFHIEVMFDDQKVVFTTRRPAEIVEKEQQALTHVLADVAQATLDSAVDSISHRFDATPGTRELTLAGLQVGGAATPPVAPGNWWEKMDRWDSLTPPMSQAVSESTLLGGSAFVLPLTAAYDGSAGTSDRPAWTLWGRGDWRDFESARDGADWVGKQWNGWLGLDAQMDEGLMAGLAFSRNQSEADYGIELDQSNRSLEASMTAVWPYLQMETEDGGTVRLILGVGMGDAEHRAPYGTLEKEDLSFLAGSVGGEMPVVQWSGVKLSAIGGASVARIETKGASETSSIGGLKAKSWRLRAGIEVEHDGLAVSSDSEWLIKPRGALALRQDGGDGVTGSGVELSGGLRLSSPGSRFALDAGGYWLAMHSQDDTQDWGASLEASLAPRADGHGLSMAFGPAWGRQRQGTLESGRLFEQESGDDEPQSLSLTARASYGFAVAGGLLTPFADAAFSGASDSHDYRAGIRFARDRMDTALTASHYESRDNDPRTGIGFEFRLHY